MNKLKLLSFCHSNPAMSETFISDLLIDFYDQENTSVTFVSGSARGPSNVSFLDDVRLTGFSERSAFLARLINKILITQSLGCRAAMWVKKRISNFILDRELGAEKFDVAYVDYLTTAVLVRENLERRCIPYVVHAHGYDITSELSDSAYRINLALVFLGAFRIIAASDHIRRLLVLEGCDPKKILVVRYGIDNTNIQPMPWGDRFDRSPSIVFLGRLTGQKHPVALLHAFKLVLDEFPEVILKIIGDGPLKSDIETRVESLGISDSVKLLGALPRSQSFPILNESCIYAQHSVTARDGSQEGFAISLAEAALHQLPVVSTFHNGIPGNVIPGETGYLVAEFDYENMAKKILVLLRDRELIVKMGEAGRKHIVQLCSRKHRADILSGVLFQGVRNNVESGLIDTSN
ncbi:MAG: glycosyltransferase [Pseudomonadales bacterium]